MILSDLKCFFFLKDDGTKKYSIITSGNFYIYIMHDTKMSYES